MPQLSSRIAPPAAIQSDMGPGFSFAGSNVRGATRHLFVGFNAGTTTTLAPKDIQCYAPNQDAADWIATVLLGWLAVDMAGTALAWVDLIRGMTSAGSKVFNKLPAGVFRPIAPAITLMDGGKFAPSGLEQTSPPVKSPNHYNLLVASNNVDTIWSLPLTIGYNPTWLFCMRPAETRNGAVNFRDQHDSNIVEPSPKTTQHSGTFTIPATTSTQCALAFYAFKVGLI